MERRKEDIEILDGKINVKVIEIDGKTINLTPVNHGHIDTYITHVDCSDCGQEFKKTYTYGTLCNVCRKIKESKYYDGLNKVQWDGVSMVSLIDDPETYFSSREDIEEYASENEVSVEDLKLMLCSKTNFNTIDVSYIVGDGELIHEDWEPSAEFTKRLDEFNEFLEKEDTQTWVPTNIAVRL